jgi:hypothetical protein
VWIERAAFLECTVSRERAVNPESTDPAERTFFWSLIVQHCVHEKRKTRPTCEGSSGLFAKATPSHGWLIERYRITSRVCLAADPVTTMIRFYAFLHHVAMSGQHRERRRYRRTQNPGNAEPIATRT